jgi:type II secretory pathway pseudopilin PulG
MGISQGRPAGAPRRDEALFTLLEVLVASAIMAISLTALLGAFSSAMRDAGVAGDYATASNLARLELDKLIFSKSLKEGDSRGSFGPAFERFSWRASVAKLSPDGKTLKIKLEVLFGEGGESRSLNLETLALPEKKDEKKNSAKR